MRLILKLTSLVCMVGCSSMQQFNEGSEVYWQALHVVDIAQTVQIAKNPHCHSEGNPWTQKLIGNNPRESEVYPWGIVSSVVHFFGMRLLDKWLDDGDYNVPLRLADNITKTSTVINNHQAGLRFDGLSNEEQVHCDRVLEAMDGPSISVEIVTW